MNPSTLKQIEDAYREIAQKSGHGVIKVTVKNAGKKGESHIVSVETSIKAK